MNPQILLIGNGISRTFGGDSWEQIIKTTLKKNASPYEYKDIENMPANMQIVVATGNQVEQKMGMIKEYLVAYKPQAEEINLYKELYELPVDAILTANYDYVLEEAVGCPHGKGHFQKCRNWTKKVKGTERKFNLFQYSRVGDTANARPIWHIHGDICVRDSMIMGHYYYGKLLSQIERYVPTFIRRYKAMGEKVPPDSVQSWVDYFLTGDVHILGFGMYLTEIDLWWLLECKARNFPDTKVYYYQPKDEVDSDIAKMMSIYKNIRIVTDIQVDNGNFLTYYTQVANQIQENILVQD